MSLYLCHECLTWVARVSDHCPECGARVDAAVPDPGLESLAEAIGTPCTRFGPVHLRGRRPVVPWGDWLVTSRGLFFGPLQRVRRATHGPDGPSDPGRRATPISFWTRVRRMLGGRDETAAPRADQPTWDRSERAATREARELAEWLMTDPGAFFVDRGALRTVRRTWVGWRILRRHAPPVSFAACSLPGVEPTGEVSSLILPPRMPLARNVLP